MRYHFIRYFVEDKLVILKKICGSKNLANMLTKGITIDYDPDNDPIRNNIVTVFNGRFSEA